MGKGFQVEGLNQSRFCQKTERTLQNGLTESNSTKELGTEGWARLKETSKEW